MAALIPVPVTTTTTTTTIPSTTTTTTTIATTTTTPTTATTPISINDTPLVSNLPATGRNSAIAQYAIRALVVGVALTFRRKLRQQ